MTNLIAPTRGDEFYVKLNLLFYRISFNLTIHHGRYAQLCGKTLKELAKKKKEQDDDFNSKIMEKTN
jgi:hypothetical protein